MTVIKTEGPAITSSEADALAILCEGKSLIVAASRDWLCDSIEKQLLRLVKELGFEPGQIFKVSTWESCTGITADAIYVSHLSDVRPSNSFMYTARAALRVAADERAGHEHEFRYQWHNDGTCTDTEDGGTYGDMKLEPLHNRVAVSMPWVDGEISSYQELRLSIHGLQALYDGMKDGLLPAFARLMVEDPRHPEHVPETSKEEA
jgi:hypothetical protein